MNPFRLLVYGISWAYRYYQEIKFHASFEYINIDKRRFRD